MTHLRQLMIEALQRRNFARSTIRAYAQGFEDFNRYFHRRPNRAGPEHIRQCQAMLVSKLAAGASSSPIGRKCYLCVQCNLSSMSGRSSG